MKGYFGNDAATAETIRDGWFHSGDSATGTPMDTSSSSIA
jgi:long-subunit acyl-CoA synthetase (AMP-forming)